MKFLKCFAIGVAVVVWLGLVSISVNLGLDMLGDLFGRPAVGCVLLGSITLLVSWLAYKIKYGDEV